MDHIYEMVIDLMDSAFDIIDYKFGILIALKCGLLIEDYLVFSFVKP